MPIFEYQCTVCKKKYEVFHIGQEKVEDIICPECNSREYKKWFSPTTISSKNTCSEGFCNMKENGCNACDCPLD